MDKKELGYETIKDNVMYEYDEYMDEEYLNVYEATGKIIEENCMVVNYNEYTRACYFLSIAIESIKMGEIESWVYEKTEKYVLESFGSNPEEEEALYRQDVETLKKLLRSNSYKVVETTGADRTRLNYLLSVESTLYFV